MQVLTQVDNTYKLNSFLFILLKEGSLSNTNPISYLRNDDDNVNIYMFPLKKFSMTRVKFFHDFQTVVCADCPVVDFCVSGCIYKDGFEDICILLQDGFVCATQLDQGAK